MRYHLCHLCRLCRPSVFLALCFAALSVAGCSSSPNLDGGIVGSGNRVDCVALAKKDGADAPTPEECKP